jgi:hypothetical protein
MEQKRKITGWVSSPSIKNREKSQFFGSQLFGVIFEVFLSEMISHF